MTESGGERREASSWQVKASPPDEAGRWTVVITGDEGDKFQLGLFASLANAAEWTPESRDPVRLKASPPHIELSRLARSKLADAWIRAIATYGMKSLPQLTQQAGANPIETVERLTVLANRGVLIAVSIGAVDANLPVMAFPAFQFDPNGQVLPVMEDISQRVGDTWDAESKLLWLTSPSGWLVDQAPADLLALEPDVVLRVLDLTLGAA